MNSLLKKRKYFHMQIRREQISKKMSKAREQIINLDKENIFMDHIILMVEQEKQLDQILAIFNEYMVSNQQQTKKQWIAMKLSGLMQYFTRMLGHLKTYQISVELIKMIKWIYKELQFEEQKLKMTSFELLSFTFQNLIELHCFGNSHIEHNKNDLSQQLISLFQQIILFTSKNDIERLEISNGLLYELIEQCLISELMPVVKLLSITLKILPRDIYELGLKQKMKELLTSIGEKQVVTFANTDEINESDQERINLLLALSRYCEIERSDLELVYCFIYHYKRVTHIHLSQDPGPITSIQIKSYQPLDHHDSQVKRSVFQAMQFLNGISYKMNWLEYHHVEQFMNGIRKYCNFEDQILMNLFCNTLNNLIINNCVDMQEVTHIYHTFFHQICHMFIKKSLIVQFSCLFCHFLSAWKHIGQEQLIPIAKLILRKDHGIENVEREIKKKMILFLLDHELDRDEVEDLCGHQMLMEILEEIYLEDSFKEDQSYELEQQQMDIE